MGVLVHFDGNANWGETRVCDALITRDLAQAGIAWGRWDVSAAAAADVPLDALLAAPQGELAALRQRFGVGRVERIRLSQADVGWPTLRRRFLAERTAVDAEVRCLVDGTGLFHIRSGTGFFGLLCEAGEWVGLPAGTRFGFDAGDTPELDALRLFVGAPGWAGLPTGRAVAPLPLPQLDEFVDEMLRLTGHLAEFE